MDYRCTNCKQIKGETEFFARYNRKKPVQSQCKDCMEKRAAKWHRDNKHVDAERQRNTRKREKTAIFTHYGIICACCGEHRQEFLCIDHIAGGGNAHRKAINKEGPAFYHWLIVNNFPTGFQTLCHNCNMAKAFYKECPHVAERRQALLVAS